MAAVTSLHVAECCHLDLVNENEASAMHLCSSVWQYQICILYHSTFVLVMFVAGDRLCVAMSIAFV